MSKPFTPPQEASLNQRHRHAVHAALMDVAPEAAGQLIMGDHGGGERAIVLRASRYLAWLETQAITQQPDFELQRRRHLRELQSLVEQELHIGPMDAKCRVDYYASVLDSAFIRAANKLPKNVIECGAHLSMRPLRPIGKGEVRYSDQLRDQILFLLPGAVAESASGDLGQLRNVFGPMLDMANRLKPLLSGIRATTAKDEYHKLLEIIALSYPAEHPDIHRAVCVLYQLQVACEGVVRAVLQESHPAHASGLGEIARYQIKPAKRELTRVLMRFGKLKESEAAEQADEFTKVVRGMRIYGNATIGLVEDRSR